MNLRNSQMVLLDLKWARFRSLLVIKTETFALALVTIGPRMEALNAMLTAYVVRCGTVFTFQIKLEKVHGAVHRVERKTVRSV